MSTTETTTMTQAERVAELARLQGKVEELVSQWNELTRTKDAKAEDIQKINEETENAVNRHVAISREICYTECKNAENPIIHAVTKLSFDTIGVRDEKDSDTGVITRTVVERTKYINLLDLNKFCGGIGADAQWVYKLEKFNCLLTAKKAVDLGINLKDINDSYAMNDISKGIDLGKTPTSNTQILKNLQTIVDAMLGEEYKATSHDVNYLNSVYSKKGKKALAVSCANHRYLCDYLARICHRIVTGASYEVEYKVKK